jgi:hypothetical protein
MMNKLK